MEGAWIQRILHVNMKLFSLSFILYSQIVDGGWSRWGAWSQCTRTCGGGRQSRMRSCTNPPPSAGGRDCPGSRAQSRICNRNGCSGKTLVTSSNVSVV